MGRPITNRMLLNMELQRALARHLHSRGLLHAPREDVPPNKCNARRTLRAWLAGKSPVRAPVGRAIVEWMTEPGNLPEGHPYYIGGDILNATSSRALVGALQWKLLTILMDGAPLDEDA